jgi:hypothetical protein
MADDDSNETEHRHRLWWGVRRVVPAVQSVCSTYARELTSFYLPPSRLLALRVYLGASRITHLVETNVRDPRIAAVQVRVSWR